MNKEQCRKYFFGHMSAGAMLLALLSGALYTAFILRLPNDSLINIGIEYLLLLLMAFPIMILVYAIIKRQGKKSCEAAIDAYIEKRASEYISENRRALQDAGNEIDYELNSKGYCFRNCFSARKALVGTDGIRRSSIVEITALYICGNTVHYYISLESLLGDEKKNLCGSILKNQLKAAMLEENGKTYLRIELPNAERASIAFNCKNEAAEAYAVLQQAST